MNTKTWLQQLFATIDNKDAQGFAAYLSAQGMFRFGNMPALYGRENIARFVSEFFQSIQSVSHQLTDYIETEHKLACHGLVSYQRLDDTRLTVPFACVLKLGTQGIDEYLIFTDNSALYAQDNE